MISGYSEEDQVELLKLLSDFSKRKPAKVSKEVISDLAPVEIQEQELENAVEVNEKAIKESSGAIQDNLKIAYNNFLERLTKQNELTVFTVYKEHKEGEKMVPPEIDSFSEGEKKAFGAAFCQWFAKRYENDPFAGDKHAEVKRRQFFNLYSRYLPKEIESAERQYGLESGSFVKSASQAQIDEAYEMCRHVLYKRCQQAMNKK